MAAEPETFPDRTAKTFSTGLSRAALNIVTYRFGSSARATRPDTVLRPPTSAILIQRSGGLYQHSRSGKRSPLPRIALLGPRAHSHVWSTSPNTVYTLVNLAPGSTRYLFDVEPREIQEQVESLESHYLSQILLESLAECPAALHAELRNLIAAAQPFDQCFARAYTAFLALRNQQYGSKVRNYEDQFGITACTLQRDLGAAVGMTPKQVLCTERARRLITLTGEGWSRSAAELAQECGFFDQSHMRYDLLRLGLGSIRKLMEDDHILPGR